MLKAIAKLFMPGAKTLSKYAADGIQKSVNDATSGKEATVARYASFAERAAETAKEIAAMMKDGSIDDLERDEIAAKVEPVMEGLLKLI